MNLLNFKRCVCLKLWGRRRLRACFWWTFWSLRSLQTLRHNTTQHIPPWLVHSGAKLSCLSCFGGICSPPSPIPLPSPSPIPPMQTNDPLSKKLQWIKSEETATRQAGERREAGGSWRHHTVHTELKRRTSATHKYWPLFLNAWERLGGSYVFTGPQKEKNGREKEGEK